MGRVLYDPTFRFDPISSLPDVVMESAGDESGLGSVLMRH